MLKKGKNGYDSLPNHCLLANSMVLLVKEKREHRGPILGTHTIIPQGAAGDKVVSLEFQPRIYTDEEITKYNQKEG